VRKSSYASVVVMLAALVNAVPSDAALHPAKARIGLKESDITGTGSERSAARKRSEANARDGAGSRSAQEWRAMAARCRNLAQWIDPEHRGVLLALAEEYEARAEHKESEGGDSEPA
jgi:hypothetical protein